MQTPNNEGEGPGASSDVARQTVFPTRPADSVAQNVGEGTFEITAPTLQGSGGQLSSGCKSPIDGDVTTRRAFRRLGCHGHEALAETLRPLSQVVPWHLALAYCSLRVAIGDADLRSIKSAREVFHVSGGLRAAGAYDDGVGMHCQHVVCSATSKSDNSCGEFRQVPHQRQSQSAQQASGPCRWLRNLVLGGDSLVDRKNLGEFRPWTPCPAFSGATTSSGLSDQVTGRWSSAAPVGLQHFRALCSLTA